MGNDARNQNDIWHHFLFKGNCEKGFSKETVFAMITRREKVS